MADQKQINKWLEDGLIDEYQAKAMLYDEGQTKEKKSKLKQYVASAKITRIITIIGAVLIGLGAVLFVSSNWKRIDNIFKLAILTSSIISIFALGFYLKYDKKKMPIVGESLIFLSTLVLGASIFLIQQMYGLQANSDILVLIWLVCVFPLIYIFRLASITALSCLISLYWLYLFVLKDVINSSASLPVLYVLSGVFLFAFGSVHYVSENFIKVGRTFRLAGIKVIMVSLFLLTFNTFAGGFSEKSLGQMAGFNNVFSIIFIVLSILTAVFIVINWFLNKERLTTSKIELAASSILVFISLIFFLIPASTNFYLLLFNFVIAGVILTLITVGIRISDMSIVNIGIFWAVVLIIVRYSDWFWDLLPRAVFFIVGGSLLILGGVFVEKKRRNLKYKLKV